MPRLAYLTIKNVSHGSIARDRFSSRDGPDVDSLERILLSVRIFWPGFNWPAIRRASCLYGFMSLMLKLALARVKDVSSARRNSTPERTAVLW